MPDSAPPPLSCWFAHRRDNRRRNTRLLRSWPSISSRPATPTTLPDLPCRRPAWRGLADRRNRTPNAALRAWFRPPRRWRRRRAPATSRLSFDGNVADLGLRATLLVDPA